MTNQPWLNRVRRQLAESNLPAAYIRRFMEELSDHCQDLTEETMSTENETVSRLGEPNQVAEAAVSAFRQRTFLGRHPSAAFLFFGISPVVLLIVLVAASACLIDVILSGIGISEQPNRLGTVGSAMANFASSLLTIVIPSVIASILYCRLVKLLGVGRTWILVSCVVLALVASLPCYWRAGSGEWMFSPGLLARGWVAHVQHPVQFLAPLVVGWWFMQSSRDRDQIQLAS